MSGEQHVQIAEIDVYPVTVPRSGVYALQRGNSAQASWFALIRVTAADGTYGWGECVTRVKSMHEIVRDHLYDGLIGHDVFDIEGFHRHVDREEMLAVERLWHWNPIRAAIEMALFDIQGKLLDVPVAQLLGGIHRRSIPVVKNVGVSSPEESAEVARAYVGDGYPLIKVRVGGDAEQDKARLSAIRSAVGSDIGIRVDANQAWTTKEAITTIRGLEQFGLEAVEQPCAFWDVESNARVTEAVDTPIISDEGFVSVPEARLLLEAGGADVLHAYLGKCGGFTPVLEIATLARAFGAQMTLGERVPLGISEVAHLHMAAALPQLNFPCALGYNLNESDLLINGPVRRGGFIDLPEGPGLGVDVDLTALARYARTA